MNKNGKWGLTKENANEILEWQLSLDAKEMDIELMQACVRILDPEFVKSGVPFEAEVWEKIKLGVKTIDEAASNPVIRMQERFSLRWRPFAIAAVIILAVFMVGTAISAAFGIDVWFFIRTWNDDEFFIEGEMQKIELSDVEKKAVWCRSDEFGALVLKHNFIAPLPTIPEDYELVESADFSSEGMRDIYALYKKEDMYVSINVYAASDEMTTLVTGYEKNVGDPVIIKYGDTECYYFLNTDYSVAVYEAENCWVDLGSSLPLEDLQKIVETIS